MPKGTYNIRNRYRKKSPDRPRPLMGHFPLPFVEATFQVVGIIDTQAVQDRTGLSTAVSRTAVHIEVLVPVQFFDLLQEFLAQIDVYMGGPGDKALLHLFQGTDI